MKQSTFATVVFALAVIAISIGLSALSHENSIKKCKVDKKASIEIPTSVNIDKIDLDKHLLMII